MADGTNAHGLRRALARAEAGKALSTDEVAFLLQARGPAPANPPARLQAPFLTPEEVVIIAEAGRKMGCKEALFTLGDRPEERYPVARAWLAERGYASTLEY